ncbi:MAG: primosomal protein N' [Gammaproteobacteria bacterium]|nr:primosomal protein N' [Gammaproteobacteria bacterium]
MSAEPTPPSYLRIAISIPLRKSFDYSLPDTWLSAPPQPGSRIKVSFGNQSAIGILLFTHQQRPDYQLKPIDEVLDYQPLLDKHLLELLNWAADYYCHAIGEVFATAIPARLRQGKAASKSPIYRWIADTDVEGLQPKLAKAPKQQALHQYISASKHGRSESELNANFVHWRSPLKSLVDKGLVDRSDVSNKPSDYQYQKPDYQLNPAQRKALDAINKNSRHFMTFLLHGVTGSGKTEIYLQASLHMLQQGKQVLILVPEIGLTPQLVASFENRFATSIAVLHSGLNDGERLDAWLSARDGSARIVIGTRSAVFVPLLAPGLIIIDEEHDSSFKQMEGFRYSARDVAIKRASLLNIPVVLGSATPSLESFSNVHAGKSTLLHLPDRTGEANHPDIFRLDLRGNKLKGGLLPHSLKSIQEEIDQGGQVLIFLNRRGYAPALVCDGCGWIAECHHCDVRMTVHKRDGRLRCHVCSHETRLPETCPDCGGNKLVRLGYGTEKLEDVLQEKFPDAGVIRIDRDSTRRKDAFNKIIQSVRSGEKKILIGTQMLAKGHHFPQVGTVIIVDADNGLYGLDFRAQEHMAQLITQVAGRAGREHRHGKVYIQTWHPEHPFFETLQNQPYHDFSLNLLKAREVTGMPPYSYLALLRVESTRMHQTETFINEANQALRNLASQQLEILGPAIAPLERKAGYFRMQLLVKSADRTELRKMLGQWVALMDNMKSGKRVRWSIDVDPYNLY